MRRPWDSTSEIISWVSQELYQAGRKVRFGRSNPELMDVPFWEMMIRSKISAYRAREHYGDSPYADGGCRIEKDPVWCFSRYGMAAVHLDDDWTVQIGGEHEDWYDPDFQIYNDVVVRNREGGVWIFGYPKEEFPPTDFHSATYHDDGITIIGNLGYVQDREWWRTPVYRLDLIDFSITPWETTGDLPGWISGHVAIRNTESTIAIVGGKRIREDKEFEANSFAYELDLISREWRKFDAPFDFETVYDTFR